MRSTILLICLVSVSAIATSCASSARKVDDARQAATSWAATVKAVTEQWAQSRVSQRFARTTLATAIDDLSSQAASIRSVDPASAARIDQLRTDIAPVMAAVARNEPDRAREAGARVAAAHAGARR